MHCLWFGRHYDPIDLGLHQKSTENEIQAFKGSIFEISRYFKHHASIPVDRYWKISINNDLINRESINIIEFLNSEDLSSSKWHKFIYCSTRCHIGKEKLVF